MKDYHSKPTYTPSGLYDRSPEDLRKELRGKVIDSRKLFTKAEYSKTIKAIDNMKPEQYPAFKAKIEKEIDYRQKHKISTAKNLNLF